MISKLSKDKLRKLFGLPVIYRGLIFLTYENSSNEKTSTKQLSRKDSQQVAGQEDIICFLNEDVTISKISVHL